MLSSLIKPFKLNFKISNSAIKRSIFISTPTDNKMSLLLNLNDTPETKPNSISNNMDVYIDFNDIDNKSNIDLLIKNLKLKCINITLTGSKEVPWFPRKLSDLKTFSSSNLLNDTIITERQTEFSKIATNHKFGDIIPHITYSPTEIQSWKSQWNEIYPRLQKYACDEYLNILPHSPINGETIPQFEEISMFLKSRTGFTICPSAGVLSSRDFFSALAYRVYFVPLRPPEARGGLFHEFVGHAPLLAEPLYADYLQQIGLASIGATEECLAQLARVYFASAEYGVIFGTSKKVYGARLLSDPQELDFSLGLLKTRKQPILNDFLTKDIAVTSAKYEAAPSTSSGDFQNVYYGIQSFKLLKDCFDVFSGTLTKSFHVRYSKSDQCLEVDRNVKVEPRKKVFKMSSPF